MTTITQADSLEIHCGYLPGAIGRIAEMHALYYSRAVGFGQYFESKVASGLAEFTGRLERPCNGLWLALQDGKIAGSIAIDGEDSGENIAHLRWFILSDQIRGSGFGRKLLSDAIRFCDQQQFTETHLWTFSGLDAARKLYEAEGFSLAQQYTASQWGKEMIEQRFVRPRTPEQA
ncbi:GNAT family N-acetyltransferase [Undibacterium sp.]|jgi:GNAT superfamily N-acetyltransferase|uniref:GNAT family N-acetyltransferase n=1 Tax=Undibacterium sp. TaxID=1914977 RepID=UPI002BBD57BA|nr:GNAT family N-acetyltransferase [Undibacterium sp.]HTD03682.1 GNAT family N-acetyltransferase [Undibacterium sp.]